MKVKLVNPQFQSNYLENLLEWRGIKDVNKFLQPTGEFLNDFHLLDNLGSAVELVHNVLENKQRVCLVVDADVDGYTSGAIIARFLAHIRPEENFISFKLHDGKQHGLEDMIDEIVDDIDKGEEYGLVILPDSSTNDFEYHEKLGELGIPVLVLDHHDLEEDTGVSKNVIIVNNQTSANYPNKELTGAGIAWQFCRAYMCEYNLPTEWAHELIDLAAVGICGDMGAVTDMENRFIMDYGFSHISNEFLKTIIEAQSYSMGGKVNATTVAFYVVPLMNAMIRVGTKEEKQILFSALYDGTLMIPSGKRGEKGKDTTAALEAVRLCNNAKAHQTKYLDSAVAMLEDKIAKEDLLENKILFIKLDEDEEVVPELTGLIAMKLAAAYKKPTLLGKVTEKGNIRGSIRGLDHCALEDLKWFLLSSGLFEYVQGHPNAAGFSMPVKNYDAFIKWSNEQLKEMDFGEDYYDVNFMCDDENISSLKDAIFSFGQYPEVWGQGNPEPKIYISGVAVSPDRVRVMGQRADTLAISTSENIKFLKFHAKELIADLAQHPRCFMEIVGHANINEYMGSYTPQIMIDAYEIHPVSSEF